MTTLPRKHWRDDLDPYKRDWTEKNCPVETVEEYGEDICPAVEQYSLEKYITIGAKVLEENPFGRAWHDLMPKKQTIVTVKVVISERSMMIPGSIPGSGEMLLNCFLREFPEATQSLWDITPVGPKLGTVCTLVT